MTDEQEKMLSEVHEWLFQARRPGAPSRAEEIDTVMEQIRAGRFLARAVLWLAGLSAAAGAIWTQLKTFGGGG